MLIAAPSSSSIGGHILLVLFVVVVQSKSGTRSLSINEKRLQLKRLFDTHQCNNVLYNAQLRQLIAYSPVLVQFGSIK